MSASCDEIVDPRVRRTRQLLQEALAKLLEKKDFDRISVQEIAEAATLNRATFYDHYADKTVLLKCMVGERFYGLLQERGVQFDGTCPSALKATVRGVCDYLADSPGMKSHMESAVIDVVRGMILHGLSLHPARPDISPEMIATTVSWAIYGAAKEWVQTPNRCASDEIVETVAALVTPILNSAPALVLGQ